MGTIDKIQKKCHAADWSVANCFRKPMKFNFVIDKLPGYRSYCTSKTIDYKKIKQTCLQNYNILFR